MNKELEYIDKQIVFIENRIAELKQEIQDNKCTQCIVKELTDLSIIISYIYKRRREINEFKHIQAE